MIGNEFTAFIAFTAQTENSPATLSAQESAGRLSLKEVYTPFRSVLNAGPLDLQHLSEERRLLMCNVKSNKALLMAQSAKVSLRQHGRTQQRKITS